MFVKCQLNQEAVVKRKIISYGKSKQINIVALASDYYECEDDIILQVGIEEKSSLIRLCITRKKNGKKSKYNHFSQRNNEDNLQFEIKAFYLQIASCISPGNKIVRDIKA